MIKKLLSFAAVIAAILISPTAHAQGETREVLAGIFGARQSVLHISLSPSGEKIAYIASGQGSTEIIYVVDLTGDGSPQVLTSLSDPDVEVTSCEWANEERLLCRVSGIDTVNAVLLGYSRMLSVAIDGSDSQMITARASSRAYGVQQNGGSIIALDVEGEANQILMTRQFLTEHSTGTRLASDDEGLGVESVSIIDGKRRTVERGNETASAYIADENGQVRLQVRRPRDGRGVYNGEVEYFYREMGESRWIQFSGDLSGFSPVAVNSALNIAYGFVNVGGFDAVYTVPLDGSGEPTRVIARDDVDVDQLIRIGRQRRVVGASFATEKREIVYLDEELGALAAQLQAALPGKPLIDIIDASADEQTLLLIASSDTDPGMTYLLDRSSNALSPLVPMRSLLAERPMVPMKPVVFPASDGTQIPGYLTLPLDNEAPMRAIVMPHGGPGTRDEWGFDWLVQYFTARGFAVLQPNFRGSTGYGDAWFGRNGFQAWETAIGDVNDAGRWLVEQGIADPDRLAIVGWSYGGYAALQSQVLDPELYQAVVAIAPVTDLDDFKEDARPYTSFGQVSRFVGTGPHVAAGSPARHADSFEAPVLLFHGSVDLNVNVRQSRRMEDRLEGAGKAVTYVEYEGLDHSLDNGGARGNMLLTIDTFLTDNLDL